jgi:uncharacterized protein (DUF58 family)
MAGLNEMLSGDELARIKNLNLYARRVVEGFCSGLHKSPHKGFSVEFKQHRPYVTGDEIRNVDWKVFGRTDRHYIREFEEETNLRCTILFDVSGSMDYQRAGSDLNKHEYARRVAASLAFLMMAQTDSVGLITFDDVVQSLIPNRSVTRHLKVLIEALAKSATGSETDIGTVFQSLVPRIGRRGLVVVISDLFGPVQPLMKSLGHLRHKGHEVLVLQIWDRDELEFPFDSWTRFINLEDADDLQLVDPSVIRKTYLANLATFRDELKRGFRRNRIDHVEMVTDQPVVAALSHYLAARARSMKK